ncbi:MAG: TerC family protein [Chthoniobacterales bacterium]|nr:TerC family protein [Chthoniobacterales bacterium]
MNFFINTFGLLVLLIGLELVLGIDNVLIIALLVDPLEPRLRQRARVMGLLIALVLRFGFVVGAFWLSMLTVPFCYHFSARDLLLLLGGLFLVAKASQELAVMVFFQKKESAFKLRKKRTLITIVTQIVLLDVLFSIDSVITAVGLTSHLVTILIAVVLSFALLLCYVKPVGEFILNHPSLKIVALAFLILIGLSFMSSSLGFPINNSLIYSAGIFALITERLQNFYWRKGRKIISEE